MSKPNDDSATALIHDIHREHSKKDAPLDVNTTGGIQRTLAMHWEAIKALADRADGVVRDETGAVVRKPTAMERLTGETEREPEAMTLE